jgi:hypothetical protein
VLDNYTVELGAEDKELVLQITRQGLKKLTDCSLRVQYQTQSHHCGKNSLATSLCTWRFDELAHLLSVIMYFKNYDYTIGDMGTPDRAHGVGTLSYIRGKPKNIEAQEASEE